MFAVHFLLFFPVELITLGAATSDLPEQNKKIRNKFLAGKMLRSFFEPVPLAFGGAWWLALLPKIGSIGYMKVKVTTGRSTQSHQPIAIIALLVDAEILSGEGK